MNRYDPDNGRSGPPPGFEPDPETGSLWLRWGTGRIAGLATFLVASNFLIQIFVYAFGGGLFEPVLAGSVAGVFAPLLWLARSNRLPLLRDLGLDNPGLPALAAAAALAVAALVPTSLLAELSLRLHPADPGWAALYGDHLPDGAAGYALAVVAVIVAAPLAEEIIFRGLLHRLASRLWGGLPATILSSLLFALIHGEPWFLLGLVGVGVMLAVVWETTRSVTACWVAHAVHNGISLGLMISSGEVAAEAGPITPQDWGWCAVSLLAFAGLARWLATRPISPRAEDPGLR